MEKYAFEYALKKGHPNIWARKIQGKPNKIQMKEIFHSIAGTSTGAILAATLAVKNDPKSNNSYYAGDVINFFLNDGPEVFQDRKINNGMLWIVTIITGLMGAWLGYKLGVMLFANPRTEKNLRHIRLIIKELKGLVKKERRLTLQAEGGALRETENGVATGINDQADDVESVEEDAIYKKRMSRMFKKMKTSDGIESQEYDLGTVQKERQRLVTIVKKKLSISANYEIRK